MINYINVFEVFFMECFDTIYELKKQKEYNFYGSHHLIFLPNKILNHTSISL